MKKALSVLLCATVLLSCLALSGFTAFASEHDGSVFAVSGKTFEDLSWDERVMTPGGDGTYRYPYHLAQDEFVKVYFTELFKDGTTRSYRPDFYLSFEFTAGEEQDIVIVCDPNDRDTPYLSVEGEDIRYFFNTNGVPYHYVYAEVNGKSRYNGQDGLMALGDDGVYSVTYRDMQPGEAVFDVSVCFGEAYLGFYGYNVFPATITDVCDVTVYYQPDTSQGYPDDYSYDCKIWAEGEYLTPNPDLTLDNVRFNFGGLPVTKVADNIYSTVIENVLPEQKMAYYEVDFETDVTYGEFYIDYDYGYPCEISDGTVVDANLYPIYYTTCPVVFRSPYQHTNVRMTLDATKLNYITKEGAVFRFDLIDMIKDVNMDGSYTVEDATILQRALAEYLTLSGNQTIAADINGDKTVNISDVTALQRFLSEFEK